jgi:ABC-type tungstate transport system permease subunit
VGNWLANAKVCEVDYILPNFKTASNFSMRVVCIDAGQAVVIDERDDANAMLFDDRPAENKIIADGYGIVRLDAMYDDFVIVGPSSDYTLADRAAWANFKNRRSLEILTEGDPALFETFGTILISPDYSTPEIWHEWLTNHHGREAFMLNKVNGEQIFFPPHLEAAH